MGLIFGRGHYQEQLGRLLPRGPAWNPEGSAMGGVLGAVAEALARLDARAADVLEEADPRTSGELFAEWEASAGLPDPCAGDSQTLDGRRAQLVGQVTEVGGQSRAFFISLAAGLGYEISIDELDPTTCEDLCDADLLGPEWRFAWRVNAPANSFEVATCESACNDFLRSWGNEVLECALEARKPAHTTILYDYYAAILSEEGELPLLTEDGVHLNLNLG